MPQIYSAQEAQTVGDVSQSIPCIDATMDIKQADHQTSIIEMDGKIFYKVDSILIYDICDLIIFMLILTWWRNVVYIKKCMHDLG